MPAPLPPSLWLVRADGTRLRVGASGRLIGRSSACDVVLEGATADVQAVVWLNGHRAEIVVNGGPAARREPLEDGDVIDVAGERLTVRSAGLPDTASRLVVWVDGRHAYGLRTLPTTIGGGSDDDLSNPAWPVHAVRFDFAGQQIVACFGTDGTVDGHTVSTGACLPVTNGLNFIIGGLRFEIRAPAPPAPPLPTRVRLVVHPRGAEFGAWCSSSDPGVSIALSVLRARLLRALLEAGPDVEVPDESLISAVWKRGALRTRLDVNQLVHRTRKHLSRAGLDGTAMIVRHPAGGSTSVHLASSATVEIG